MSGGWKITTGGWKATGGAAAARAGSCGELDAGGLTGGEPETGGAAAGPDCAGPDWVALAGGSPAG
ncbi:MAG: hypothetical protein ACLQI7_20600 [Streptosporangiaceae bacterium]|jgi:hypothetical protein